MIRMAWKVQTVMVLSANIECRLLTAECEINISITTTTERNSL